MLTLSPTLQMSVIVFHIHGYKTEPFHVDWDMISFSTYFRYFSSAVKTLTRPCLSHLNVDIRIKCSAANNVAATNQNTCHVTLIHRLSLIIINANLKQPNQVWLHRGGSREISDPSLIRTLCTSRESLHIIEIVFCFLFQRFIIIR